LIELDVVAALADALVRGGESRRGELDAELSVVAQSAVGRAGVELYEEFGKVLRWR
jgi:hypothetical protein